MQIWFNNIYIRDSSVALFEQLTAWEKRRVKGNKLEVYRLIGHFCCSYHPDRVVSVRIALEDGLITNSIYSCCPAFTALLRQVLTQSTTPYRTLLLAGTDPRLWN